MGFIRQTSLVNAFLADSKEDLSSLPQTTMGSICYVIDECREYICNSKGKWIAKRKGTEETVLDNYYTKHEVKEFVEELIEDVKVEPLTTTEILAITMQNL